jgi:3,4-dihydroxy 2-butanone 4-phosphate synthase/GTP cyclohydrolase II
MLDAMDNVLEDLRQGKPIILVDDEDRENEGDLVIAAEHVTPEGVNFMAKFGRGLICMPLTPERVAELDLPPMVHNNTSTYETGFCVSIGAKAGNTTGISAYDRANTVRVAIDPNTKPEDLSRPGHVFPLRARPGGVLERAGHTEGSIELARMAGLYPASLICEIMSDDGSMARMPELREFAKQHNLKITSIAEIVKHQEARA